MTTIRTLARPKSPSNKTPRSTPIPSSCTSNELTTAQEPTADMAWVETVTTADLWARFIVMRRNPNADAQATEELRNALIVRHLPLVRHVAENLARNLPRHLEVESLVSAGVLGLMDAIRGYDSGRGVMFKTYAGMRVRGAMLDMMRSEDWVPRLVRTRAAQIERAIARLSGLYEREPTRTELASELNLDHNDLTQQLQDAQLQRMICLVDTEEGHENGDNGLSSIADPRALRPEDIVHRRQAMAEMTRSFTQKESFILKQYYECDYTLREIGDMLDLTESRICQIHSNLVKRLRSRAHVGQHQGSA
jgi:RNA polymerase sigma factor FliA